VIDHAPRGHHAWLTLLAVLLLGPLAHALGALGLPTPFFDAVLGLPMLGFVATALFWCALLLPAVALATWRRAEPVAILLVAVFWSWTALHAASAQGWLPATVPPLPFG
jgi:hypothetical protein